MSTTKSIQHEFVERYDLPFNIFDTPPLEDFDFNTIRSVLMEKMKMKNVVYLIVIKVGRFEEEEQDMLSEILTEVGLDASFRIIFTNVAQLSNEGKITSLRDWIGKNSILTYLMQRYHIHYNALENGDKGIVHYITEILDCIDLSCNAGKDERKNTLLYINARKFDSMMHNLKQESGENARKLEKKFDSMMHNLKQESAENSATLMFRK